MKKRVAFVCVHNSCRSQIAEALAKKYGNKMLEVYSAGTHIKDELNMDAVRLVKNLYDIDMEKTQKPKLLSEIPEVDYFITMGCGVECPILEFQAKIEDWGLEDPTGKSDDVFIKTIHLIEDKVIKLIESLELKID